MFISVSSQTTLQDSDNFFVFALYDATAPAVLLESIQPPKPYGDPLQISFTYNCLNGHIYIIKLWESPDDTPTGVVRNSFSQSVNSNQASVLIKMDEYLEVDVTADLTNTTTAYVNTDWAGWEYSIERVGQGTMIPDFTDNTNPNYHQDLAGGITLITTDDSFQPHEKFVARFIPQVISVPADGAPSAIFSTGRVITANETLTLADMGQALLIQSATNKITITLPALVGVANFAFMYFYSCGGSHINAVFQLPGSDKFLYNGADRSQLILGQSESLRVYKAFGKWNVDSDCPGIRMVGELVYNYALTPINSMPCNGTLISRTVYPRLWAWVQQLESGTVVTDIAWTSTFATVDAIDYYIKKGCFSTGDGSTTFRLPLIDSYFLRPVDGATRIPSTFEIQSIQAHTHPIRRGDAYTGDGFEGDLIVGGGQGGNRQTSPDTDSTGGVETRPSNIGTYILIRI